MQVADAVYESVLPRKAGHETATSPAGILLSVADRCDHSVSSSSDQASCQPKFRIHMILYRHVHLKLASMSRGLLGAVPRGYSALEYAW